MKTEGGTGPVGTVIVYILCSFTKNVQTTSSLPDAVLSVLGEHLPCGTLGSWSSLIFLKQIKSFFICFSALCHIYIMYKLELNLSLIS